MHPASALRAGTPPDAGRRADCAGHIALELKRVWHDGTRELVFEPLELLERLAAITRTAGKEPADLPRLTQHSTLPPWRDCAGARGRGTRTTASRKARSTIGPRATR